MIKLELSEHHLEIIGRALGNLTYAVAAPVVSEINRQWQAQQRQPNTK